MSEPPYKRRKIADPSPGGHVAPSMPIDLTGSPPRSDDEELMAAIRMSLEDPSATESSVPSPLTDLRMLQRQKYETHKLSLSNSTALSSGTEDDPSLLNVEGKTVFVNKLPNKASSADCLDLRDIVCKAYLESGIIGGVFDEAIQELFYFFQETTPLLLCTKPSPGPTGLGLLTAPSAWKMIYASSLVHAKFMVLFFPRYLRLVIASGNFTQVEYESIRQVIWYQDFPKLDKRASRTEAEFSATLSRFLLALNVPHSSVESIHNFDFSQVKATLIASIPANEASVPPQAGLTQLRRFTSTLPPFGDNERVVVQTNTVSMASDAWLSEFVEACGRKPRSGAPKTVANQLKVVYPTKEVFLASKIEGDAFSVVLFKGQLPRNRFSICLDTEDKRTLLHSKIVYPESGSWLYIGSHNLTKSAWGSSKTSATNFELGIVFLKDSWTFRIPFRVPLQGYGPDDSLGGVVRNWDPSN